MKTATYGIGTLLLIAAATHGARASSDENALIVTASNTANNQLMIYSSHGQLLKTIPTQGQGGVSGNAGGIARSGKHLAAVNFGSGNVSIFAKDTVRPDLRFEHLVTSLGNPVSVAFGPDHLYILTTTHVESHRLDSNGVDANADGSASLIVGDGSAAQVGVLPTQLIVSEKSNAIETVALDQNGAITGLATLVANIPTNVNAPFGLATRGNDAYVTIAHANEISLVRNGGVLKVTGSGTQSSPCWVTLDGPFLFSANSPSHSVSRYAVYGQQIIQDAAVVATFNGNPTDIAYRASLAAVVDANGTASHVSVFRVDEDGNFSLQGLATIANVATNGMAIVRPEDGLAD
jgi:hypothetical protein